MLMPSSIAPGTIPYSEENYTRLVNTMECHLDTEFTDGLPPNGLASNKNIRVLFKLTLDGDITYVEKKALKYALTDPTKCAINILTDFLYNVPLEDVPLYVNSYPELAKMRLTKGR
jgi:hypothetical protein